MSIKKIWLGDTDVYCSTASYTLPNGGLAGMVWMYLVSLFGFSFAILSMAEMASMYITQSNNPASSYPY